MSMHRKRRFNPEDVKPEEEDRNMKKRIAILLASCMLLAAIMPVSYAAADAVSSATAVPGMQKRVWYRGGNPAAS